jgi:archaellum component FlaG (FlaF/FlaG flagellin family)
MRGDDPAVPLKSLHPEGSLSQPKLTTFRKRPTEELIASLQPGEPGALKVKADGTIMDGHHRVYVLRERGVDIDALPREPLE